MLPLRRQLLVLHCYCYCYFYSNSYSYDYYYYYCYYYYYYYYHDYYYDDDYYHYYWYYYYYCSIINDSIPHTCMLNPLYTLWHYDLLMEPFEVPWNVLVDVKRSEEPFDNYSFKP